MATIDVTANRNTNIQPANGDTVIIRPNVTVTAPLDGINGFSVSDLIVQNYGTVDGDLIGASVSSRSSVTVYTNGVFVGSAVGLWLNGSDTEVDNAGTLRSDGTGFSDLFGALSLNSATGATITNSGDIIGGRYGVQLKNASDAELTNTGTITGVREAIVGNGNIVIDNSGEIRSSETTAISISNSQIGFELKNTGIVEGAGIAVQGTQVADTIRNTGAIRGDVQLGAGDDLYEDGSLGSVDGEILAGAGRDTVRGGGNADVVRGEAGQDVLSGNGGDDTLDGGLDADTLTGGFGNDTYIVDNAGDQVFEQAGGGTDDRVFVQGSASLTSYTLAAGLDIETLATTRAIGGRSLDLTGNEIGQVIYGNAGSNVLDGKSGTDTLDGYGGADTFAFSTALGVNNVDRIVDFSADDAIRLSKSIFTELDLGTLSEGAFKDLGAAGATVDADDRILYDAKGRLFYDADGAGGADAVLFAKVSYRPVLTHDDFFVV